MKFKASILASIAYRTDARTAHMGAIIETGHRQIARDSALRRESELRRIRAP